MSHLTTESCLFGILIKSDFSSILLVYNAALISLNLATWPQPDEYPHMKVYKIVPNEKQCILKNFKFRYLMQPFQYQVLPKSAV